IARVIADRSTGTKGGTNLMGDALANSDEFARAGLPLVCCPGVAGWQSHGTRMAQGNANIAKFARVARANGAEGLLNTDWGDYGHRNSLGASMHGFAFGAAHSWGGAQVRNRHFTDAFAFHAFGDKTGKLADAIRALGSHPGGELYHTLIEPIAPDPRWRDYMIGYRRNDSADARLCGCGHRGHLEAYASATAVIKRASQALSNGHASSLAQRVAEGAELTPKLLGAEAEAGDELSLKIILEVAEAMGVGIVNLLHTIDPNGVLLGGAMTFGGNKTELGRRFLARIKQEVDHRAFAVLAQRTIIDFASLGGDAGYIGAAGIARVEHLKH
ncbi:hypothetical protein LCGC14_1901450, partial [marine sediment metagenome]